jgi:hypothetical protein
MKIQRQVRCKPQPGSGQLCASWACQHFWSPFAPLCFPSPHPLPAPLSQDHRRTCHVGIRHVRTRHARTRYVGLRQDTARRVTSGHVTARRVMPGHVSTHLVGSRQDKSCWDKSRHVCCASLVSRAGRKLKLRQKGEGAQTLGGF